MNKKVFAASQKVNSKLTRRHKNKLIEKYGDELYERRNENHDEVVKDIVAREGVIASFLLSFMISFFLRKILESLID